VSHFSKDVKGLLAVVFAVTGSWRSVATAKETDVLKVPSTIPVEFAATLNIPLTALRLLEDFGALSAGDVVLQTGAETAVGKAVIQVAKAKGLRTINVISDVPGYLQNASFLKELGADIVVPAHYAESDKFSKLLADYTKPKLGISGGAVDTGVWKVLAPGASVVSLGSEKPSAPAAKTFSLAAWYKKSSGDAKAKAISEVAELVEQGAVRVWLERYPLESINYALEKAAESDRIREVVLTINELPKPETPKINLEQLNLQFEHEFNRLRL